MTSASTIVRTVEGNAVPVPGTYVIDPTHSSVEAVVRHLVSKVRGSFADFSGTIEVAEDPLQSRVEVEIEATSIDTRTSDRDTHLRSADFLDVERFPHLRFVSRKVAAIEGSRWRLEGDLTIRDTTRPVTLDFEFLGEAVDPWGNQRIAFEATGELDREDFGMTWNQALETGGFLVGKTLKIEIEIQATKS
jgi:polyisoprenoid-binding protein YceI